MRFNLGEVWRSVEAGGAEPRRAVVSAIEDDGRKGTLFFDNGDEQSFLWAELTQAGKWQLDNSPKPTRSADDLKALILQKMQNHPVCPSGMSVEIRHTSGDDWEALGVPPPGQHIAYADCVHYISTVARSLRLLFGVRTTTVVANVGVPTGWMNAGDDAANAVARMTAERQRRAIAATQSGPTEPIGPVVPVSPEPSASTAPATGQLSGRATIRSGGFGDLSVNRTSPAAGATDVAATVERKLGEQPAEIREAARALSTAIADQIAELDASKPNEPERLARQDDFIAFLHTIAAGLDALAVSIDRAIAAGSIERPEPILLGKAGEIARQISTAVAEGLERNRNYIVDCSIKFCVFAAGFTFLHAIGVDGYIAGAVAALMNVKLSGGGGSKK
jgi:hypothetical protein